MCKRKKNYEIMANRKMLWLVSVVIISVGLICNILLGVDMDIRFTGGAMLRYSYPESGIVSMSDVPASAVPSPASGTDVNNEEPAPALAPVIISDSDASAAQTSSSDAPVVTNTDLPQQTVSDGQPGVTVPSASDAVTSTDVPEITFEPDYSTNVDPAETGRILTAALGQEVTVQISTDAVSPTGGENKRLTVTFAQGQMLDQGTDEIIRRTVGEKYPNVVLTLRESNSVDPTVGSEFVAKCVMAVLIAALFMTLYMGLRYRSIGGWTAAVSAMVAIVHDCLVAYFAFVVFGFTIGDHFIAVLLAIIGLSLNSTIVIFDRIRENRRLLGDDTHIAEVADRSINESLGRTVSTDLCVFIAMAVLAVVSAVRGLDSMLSFAVPMMFGVAAGCYSSLCISSTIWVTWQEALLRRQSAKECSVVRFE